MPISHRLLRPVARLIAAIAGGILTTIGLDNLTDISGQALETIQSA